MANENFYRPRMRKSIWCEGCGLGNLQDILVNTLIAHVAEKVKVDPKTPDGLDKIKNNIAMVSGIGCTSRLPGHMDVNSLHTTHGRALGFATGIKMARPDLTVVLAAGDGDLFAIGGNHFIHAARRNLDMTLICYDNQSYGMTGAQHSPSSTLGEIGTSAPYGVFEPPFDLINLAIGAGITFVAQAAITTSQEHQEQLERLILEALNHKGFSFVNVKGTCHTGWGTKNKRSDPYKYRQYLEKIMMPYERWKELSPREQTKFVPLGVIFKKERPDLQSSPFYQSAVTKAMKETENEKLEQITLKAIDPLAPLKRTSIRFAGSGGHGVISAGEIALQAALEAGQNGVYTKNYGPEARGGQAFSDIIISEGDIHHPVSESLDVLLALNQETFDKFRDQVSPKGTIIVNATSVTETYKDPRVVASPIGELHAREVRPPRRDLGINVLALAVTLGYLGSVERSALEAAVMYSVGKRNPELNRRALSVGFREADRLRSLSA